MDALVRAVQPDIYAVALRMLWNREDAEDATQEILVRVVTQLSSFNFRSRLKTWVYRVAVNHLLDRKRSAVERMELNFVRLSEDAEALDVDPGVLRKRLERARSAILAFTRSYCGLVSDDAACRCNRRVTAAVRLGRARPDALEFADRA